MATIVKEDETVITTVTTVEPLYAKEKWITGAKRSIFCTSLANFVFAIIALVMTLTAWNEAQVDIASVR